MPRGIAADGPAVLSYGFRPFFLLAGIFAPIALVVWIGALAGYALGQVGFSRLSIATTPQKEAPKK